MGLFRVMPVGSPEKKKENLLGKSSKYILLGKRIWCSMGKHYIEEFQSKALATIYKTAFLIFIP